MYSFLIRSTYIFAAVVIVMAISISVPALVQSSSAKKIKVEICHIPPGNPDNAHVISVSEKAVQAHLNHGDKLGSCFTPSQVCDEGVDSESGAPWVICELNENDAWISHVEGQGGTYNAVSICQELGYDFVSEWGGTFGNECGYVENPTSCENPGNKFFNGAGGNDPTNISNTVMWTCVKF